MNHGLQIPEKGALDFLALGAVVHRLDSGVIPFHKASECKIHVSGGEYNVAANLSDCFKLQTGIATAMVNYPVGELVTQRVRAMGVKGFYKNFEHDGVTGPNIATVYCDTGFGIRGPVAHYNRANEAAAMLKPGDFDWKAIFGGGVRWFHSGGIFASLSPTTCGVILEAMKAAKEAGAIVSFDLNYRARLWKNIGGREKFAAAVEELLDYVDVLFGNPEALLDKPDDTENREIISLLSISPEWKFDKDAYIGALSRLLRWHQRVKIFTTTVRKVHSATRQSWSAVTMISGELYQAPVCQLEILDRVGAGDAYAAGFIYGILAGESPQRSVDLGWAHGALVSTLPGDTTMVNLEQVKNFAGGQLADIQR
jgi:2-dehydro-3-deoxygluconokinase